LAVSATIGLPLGAGNVSFSGSVSRTNIDIQGRAHFNVVGFSFDAGVHLTNSSMAVSATIGLPLGAGNVSFSGTVSSRAIDIRGPAHFNLVGFSSNAALHLTKSSMQVSASIGLPFGAGNVSFSGSVSRTNIDIQGTAHFNIIGFSFNAGVHLTNSSMSVSASI